MFEPVTITRSTSVVMDGGAGEGFWPDAIDANKSAAPTLAAKATATESGLTWGIISDLGGSDYCDFRGLPLTFASENLLAKSHGFFFLGLPFIPPVLIVCAISEFAA